MIFFIMVITSIVAGYITDKIVPNWSYNILLDENRTPPKRHGWILYIAWPYFVIMKYKHKKRILENL